MAELRELLEGLGWRDVQTYLQSGQAAFTVPDTGPMFAQPEVSLAATLTSSAGRSWHIARCARLCSARPQS